MSDSSTSSVSSSQPEIRSYLDKLPVELKVETLHYLPEAARVAVGEAVPSMRGCVIERLAVESPAVKRWAGDSMARREVAGRLLAARSHMTTGWNSGDVVSYEVNRGRVSKFVALGDELLLACSREAGILELVEPLTGSVAYEIVLDDPHNSVKGVAAGADGRLVTVRSTSYLNKYELRAWNHKTHAKLGRPIEVNSGSDKMLQGTAGGNPVFIWARSWDQGCLYADTGRGTYDFYGHNLDQPRSISTGRCSAGYLALGLSNGRIQLVSYDRAHRGSLDIGRYLSGHASVPRKAQWNICTGDISGKPHLFSALNNELKMWDLSGAARGRIAATAERKGRGVITSMTLVPFPTSPGLLIGTSKGDVELWDVGADGLTRRHRSHVSDEPIGCLDFNGETSSPVVMMRTGDTVRVLGLLQYEVDDIASAPSEIASDAYSRSRTSAGWKLALATSALALALLGVVGVGRLAGSKLIPPIR